MNHRPAAKKVSHSVILWDQ